MRMKWFLATLIILALIAVIVIVVAGADAQEQYLVYLPFVYHFEWYSWEDADCHDVAIWHLPDECNFWPPPWWPLGK
jgi:hypothetical protein